MKDIQADVNAIQRIAIVPSLLDVVCRTTGMGFAAIARVTEEKWVICGVQDNISFGLHPGGELKLETTICNEIRQSGKAVIIDDVSLDEGFAFHHTPAMYGFQSYISFPIIKKNGDFFGTLCAIDPKPAHLNNPATIGMFTLFADLISFHLQAVEELATTDAELQEERKTGELREQFIAILGHDLRNPVGAISNSVQLMQQMPIAPEAKPLVNVIKNSSFRILGLIGNMLDLARGRQGKGFILNRRPTGDLHTILTQVITEMQAVWPGRKIESSVQLPAVIVCDGPRVAQLFSNLLGNALSYGKETVPVKVTANCSERQFALSVSNAGEPIPETAMGHLFTAFSRAAVKPGHQGLGLGLYIAAEIARAHGGEIKVSSTPEETRFTFQMPLE